MARLGGIAAGAASALDGAPAVDAPRWVAPLLQDLSVTAPVLVLFAALCMAAGVALLVWP